MADSGSESKNIVSIEAEVVEKVVSVTDKTPLLNDIWQCERIETFCEIRKNEWCAMMRCLHYNETFNKSATKTEYHLGQIRGRNIKICNSTPP